MLQAADPHMRAVLLLCAHGRLRVREALDLEWADVRLDARELTVRRGKGGKQRRVVGKSLAAALGAVNVEKRVVGGSYPAAVERLQRLCARTGVLCRGHHALRHYAGTRLTREGPRSTTWRGTWGTRRWKPRGSTPSGATRACGGEEPGGDERILRTRLQWQCLCIYVKIVRI